MMTFDIKTMPFLASKFTLCLMTRSNTAGVWAHSQRYRYGVCFSLHHLTAETPFFKRPSKTGGLLALSWCIPHDRDRTLHGQTGSMTLKRAENKRATSTK